MDVRKVGTPYGDEITKYLIEIIDFTTYEQNDKVFIDILNFRPVEPKRTGSDLNTVSIKKEVKFEDKGYKSGKK